MATQKFYRVVNPLYEAPGKLCDTNDLKHIKERDLVIKNKPLFDELWDLWRQSNAQMLTILHSLVAAKFEYIDMYSMLQEALDRGFMVCDADSLIMTTEQVKFSIPQLLKVYQTWGQYPDINFDNIYVFWQYVLDKARETCNPSAPNRLDSLFMFDSIKAAQQFMGNKVGLRIFEVDIKNTRKLHICDESIYNAMPPKITYNDFMAEANKYWNNFQNQNPKTEYLFQGEYELLTC